MRAKVLYHMVERDTQVFEQCHFRTRLIVPWHHFVEYREIASLFDISYSTKDKPAGVVIETTTDIIVATLGQWLVLVIAATIRELC